MAAIPFRVPESWPRWNKVCGANLRKRPGQTCRQRAVIGQATCRLHGSGGQRNRELGQLKYLCWIICGGPQDMPVEHACRVAFAVYAEAVLNRGEGSPDQQMKAAMWLTQMTEM